MSMWHFLLGVPYHDSSSCRVSTISSFVSSPTITNVGASSFFADGMQVESAKVLFDFVEWSAGWYWRFEIRRKSRTECKHLRRARQVTAKRCVYPLVFPRTTRSGASPEMKSSKLGPFSKLCENLLLEEGRDDAEAVARQRLWMNEGELRRTLIKWAMFWCRDKREWTTRLCERKSWAFWGQVILLSGLTEGCHLFISRLLTKYQLEKFPDAFLTMNSLSRREEETLLKATKAHALQECDIFVRGKHICLALNLEINLLSSFLRIRRLRFWSNRFRSLEMQRPTTESPRLHGSIVIHFFHPCSRIDFWTSTAPEPMEEVRREYIRLRNQRQEASS